VTERKPIVVYYLSVGVWDIPYFVSRFFIFVVMATERLDYS
jgi:hypothetical protein